MDCPDCGYMMTAFDQECPRCKTFKAKGKTAPPIEGKSSLTVQSPRPQPPAEYVINPHEVAHHLLWTGAALDFEMPHGLWGDRLPFSPGMDAAEVRHILCVYAAADD